MELFTDEFNWLVPLMFMTEENTDGNLFGTWNRSLLEKSGLPGVFPLLLVSTYVGFDPGNNVFGDVQLNPTLDTGMD